MFGLFQERVHNNHITAQKSLNRSLNKDRISAVLVCFLGELLVLCGQVKHAKKWYIKQLHKLKDETELTEVYVVSAWIDGKKRYGMDGAVELLKQTLTITTPRNSTAQVALAHLERRICEQKNEINNRQ